jgi:DNA-binding NtrC family response regulator
MRLQATRNILCIDADDHARLLIAELLYERDVDFALTAEDAIQLAHSRAYCLCFIDPAVPGFGDFDVLAEVRAFDPHLPIVISSGSECAFAANGAVQGRLSKPLCAFAVREMATRLISYPRPCI